MNNCSIIKKDKVIYSCKGYNDDIENPVELRIVLEEKYILKIKEIANFYKWPLEDAITEILAQDPQEIIEKKEMEAQGII